MLILAAVAPVVVLLLFFYKVDKFEPEPKRLLFMLYILGMLSVIPVLILETILTYLNIFTLFDNDLMNLYDALVVAGFSEELFKWIIVMIFVFRSREFDEYIDGIIYCVFVSLGFATVENILYVLEGSYSVAITRAILSVPAHMLFGVSMGYYLSFSKFGKTPKIRNRYMMLSLVVPILLHGGYDYILMSDIPYLLVLFIPFVIWMWVFNIKKLKLYYNNAKLNSEYRDQLNS